MTIFDEQPRDIKGLAYGWRRRTDTTRQGGVFRVERGAPFYRSGQLVAATPQFKALNLFSPTIKNVKLPTVSVTPSQVRYPTAAK